VIVAYTSIYGGYDPLRPHPDHPDVDRWVAYTDDPGLVCDGWETVVEPPRYAHPRLSAKWRKCHPPEAEWSVWLDGSVHLTSPAYIDMLAKLLAEADLAMFPHPDRDNIRAEAQASLELAPAKYAGRDVHGQVDRYEARRPTAGLGLWATTTFARRHSPAVLQMGAAWMAHCELATYQDQLSLPVLVADYGLRVAPVTGGTLLANPWWSWLGHARSD
jgi:hypothetical protein